MKKVFKYELSWSDETRVEMPYGVVILYVGLQKEIVDSEPGFGLPNNENIFLWASVDDTQPKETRVFKVFGTGQVIEPGKGMVFIYLGTVQTVRGFVWHVYEEQKMKFNNAYNNRDVFGEVDRGAY